jgi:hypothetical protein
MKASKHSIQTGAGVIDADYRGPVMVLLFNHSDNDFEGMSFSLLQSNPYWFMVNEIKADRPVNPKDRIAQMILERISVPRLQQVEVSLLRSMDLGLKAAADSLGPGRYNQRRWRFRINWRFRARRKEAKGREWRGCRGRWPRGQEGVGLPERH